MVRVVWACEDCGWEWPAPAPPSEDSECDSCGGPLERVDPVFVTVIDALTR